MEISAENRVGEASIASRRKFTPPEVGGVDDGLYLPCFQVFRHLLGDFFQSKIFTVLSMSAVNSDIRIMCKRNIQLKLKRRGKEAGMVWISEQNEAYKQTKRVW